MSKAKQPEDLDQIMDEVAEIAARLYTALASKPAFTPNQAFKLTQVFLYEAVKDAELL